MFDTFSYMAENSTQTAQKITNAQHFRSLCYDRHSCVKSYECPASIRLLRNVK